MIRVALVDPDRTLNGLGQRLAGLDPDLQIVELPKPSSEDPASVVVTWNAPADTFRYFPKVRLAHSPAAGGNHLLSDPFLAPQVPICRVVDPDQRDGMADFVSWAVLYYHRGLDAVFANRGLRHWWLPPQKDNRETRVGILGLGQMGAHAASRLAGLGFAVRGWSRRPRKVLGVHDFFGDDQLQDFLRGLNILICLLPLTQQTAGILNRNTFRALAKDAVLINLGRGEHLLIEDLREALDKGQLKGALLDVFSEEPLPPEDDLWKDPRLLITPHMASSASSSAIARQIAANIARLRQGLPLLNQVDRAGGY